jgi:thiol:disulfide interchange protein DsbD
MDTASMTEPGVDVTPLNSLLKRHVLLGMVLVLCGCALNTMPAAAAQDGPVVSVQTAWSTDRARPGDPFRLAVVFEIKQGYHINADAGQLEALDDIQLIPTRVTVKAASAGVTLASPRFPEAHPMKVSFSQRDLMVFSGRTAVYLTGQLAHGSPVDAVRLEIELVYQACDAHVCLFPEKKILTATLPVAEAGRQPLATHPEIFGGAPTATAASPKRVGFDMFGWRFSLNPHSGWGFSLLLLTAALGGLLLNFTPCVLPLLPIKIMSLSNAAGNPSRCLALGFSTFLGVIAFWLVLGSAIALISGFTATNQLFQYPLFTILIGVIIGIMALGMWGLFSVRLPGFIYRINVNYETLSGSFIMGILAAILSTPCTAPFMGAAAAWAATRHPLTTLATFAAIGLGMALPYLILSAASDLVRKMPRSGPASQLIKEIMSLFMLAAAAYFIGSGLSAVLAAPPNPPGKFYWWVVMGFVAAGGFRLVLGTLKVARSKVSRWVFTGLGILLVAGAVFGGLRLTDDGPIDWIHYTPERLAHASEAQKIVFIVFTAEWCLNCKALEEGVLSTPAVAALLAEADIVPIKVDITGNNPAGKALLKSYGSLTIPFLVIMSSQKTEAFRSDYYTADQLLETVEDLRKQAPAG